MITRALRLGPVAYTPHDKLSLADRARRQAAQRQMARFLRRFVVVTAESESKKIDVVEKVFVDLARRFKDRPGGYTRIIKTGRRRGDNAPMSIVELVVRGEAKDEKAKPSKGATKNESPKPETPAKAAPAASGKDAESGDKGEKESAGAPKPAAADAETGKTTKAAKAAANADATKPKAEAESSEDKAEAKKPRRAKSKPQGDGD
jgi:large subunit ribosomal protein L17